jgi:hypothetical protein
VISYNPKYLPIDSEGARIFHVAAGTTTLEISDSVPFIVTVE